MIGILDTVLTDEKPISRISEFLIILEGKKWVFFSPYPCLSNPWEQDWLKSHNDDYASYPRNEENAIIQNYYKNQGITVFDLRIEPNEINANCEGCNCHSAYWIYLLVSNSDIEKMKQFGFRVEEN